MTESQELFEPSQINEDELIEKLLTEENEELNESTQNEADKNEENKDIAPEKIATAKSTSFPLGRIKTLMKLDPDVNLTSSEAVFLVTKATELFLKNLVQETYNCTAKSKRKLIQRRDVDAAIENIDALCFLEGAIDF